MLPASRLCAPRKRRLPGVEFPQVALYRPNGLWVPDVRGKGLMGPFWAGHRNYSGALKVPVVVPTAMLAHQTDDRVATDMSTAQRDVASLVGIGRGAQRTGPWVRHSGSSNARRQVATGPPERASKLCPQPRLAGPLFRARVNVLQESDVRGALHIFAEVR